MTTEHKCLKEFEKVWPFPFSTPLIFDKDTLDLLPDAWCVRASEKTPSGNRSTKGATVVLNFCPFCGASLSTEESSNNDD